MASRQDCNTSQLGGRDLPLRTEPTQEDYSQFLREDRYVGTCLFIVAMSYWEVLEGGSKLVH